MRHKNTFSYLTAFFLISNIGLFSQTLPTGLVTDWSKAGIQKQAPVFDTVNVLSNGAVADGATSNNPVLRNLMDADGGQPTVYYFPAGNYFFDEPIALKNGQVIKGASAGETTFIFNLNGAGHAFLIEGAATGIKSNITNNILKDASSLNIENTAAFQTGDYIRTQADDIDLITSPWAEHSTGQICEINQIQNNTLHIAETIRRDYLLNKNPLIEKISPVQFAGIECLRIERLDATAAQTSNIYFKYAANCWAKGLSSHNANFAHIDIENGAHINISGCHFKDAHAYGDGGQGYGVVLEFNTSDCLVENNIFDHLRHSMLLQAGANGNVLGYNCSVNTFWTEVGLPDDSSGDLVLHGNYVYLNLLEGNIVQNIVIDDSHGINGPGNVFFRNRAEQNGIFMNDSPASDAQVFVGNEITSTDFLNGFYSLEGTGHFEYGNNVKGTVMPANTNNVSLLSLYLNEAPIYFENTGIDIGSIGLPTDLNSGSNPARLRLEDNLLTLCEKNEPVVNSVKYEPAGGFWNIYPNPAKNILNIENKSINQKYSASIIDLNGRIVFYENMAAPQIDVSGLNSGLYILVLENNKRRVFKKINILR
ncbi:MAG TPA: T9SS type A sorting domain-containing protein [Bacteroidetes bacterium]|nr:T9SS type A sorting domain-containing protein [Bacteroidota bacterium]